MRQTAGCSPLDYARLPQVVARAREFCGWISRGRPDCVYVAGMDARDGPHVTWGHVPARPPEALMELLAAGADVARSLWDTGHLLVYLDLDYRNAEEPGEVFVHPADAFLKLEPIYRGVLELFDELGAPMLNLVTGAGYAFVGQIALAGEAAARLSSLATAAPPWLASHAGRRPTWAGAAIDERQARAHFGLGLVLEHLAHRLLSRLASRATIPLVMNNVDVGRGPGGRECLSLDLTLFGDPLDTRHLRIPFSLYQRHRLRPDLVGERAARRPPLAIVPRGRKSLIAMLDGGRELEAAAEQARWTSVAIPDVERGVSAMLDDYLESDLAVWHRGYYADRDRQSAEAGRPPGLGPSGLPPCAAACLERPNDLLLEPAHVQHLVRILLARGWSPRAIAGLVQGHYLRPGIWGQHWRRAEPETRADFDVRVFAGWVACGGDRGVDFNCVSTQEKGMCPGGACAIDLRDECRRLLERGRA